MSANDQGIELLATAATTVAWAAVPDYVEGRRGQRLARGAVLTLSAGAFWLTREARQPAWERAEDDRGRTAPPPAVGGARQAALVVGSVLAVPAAVAGGGRLHERAVETLRRRGVRRPRTWVGLGWALVGLARPAADLARRRTAG